MTDATPDPRPTKPPSERADAFAVMQRLREAGHVAYFAGGCVRDTLLGLNPKDFDVATDAPPDRVRQLFKNTQAVGVAFGVILVRHGKSIIEVATFRIDDKYEDGRRPSAVHFTTAEEDAQRRDFTINGLFFDPIENKVIDFVGGQEDLKNKTLRAIGDPNHRFAEDHLRLLRAVRFAARFDLTIEPTTASAIRGHASHLTRISPERIAEELRLMLIPSTRDRAYQLLSEFGLLDVIFRLLPNIDEPQQGDRPKLLLAVTRLSQARSISFGLALAALTLELRINNTAQIDLASLLSRKEVIRVAQAMNTALKFSNDEYESLVGSLSFDHLLTPQLPREATLKRFLARVHSSDARLLLAALAACGIHRDLIDRLLAELNVLEKTDVAPPSLITGDDLIAAGLSPGPKFKQILDATYDEQLENRLITKDAALAFALKLARS